MYYQVSQLESCASGTEEAQSNESIANNGVIYLRTLKVTLSCETKTIRGRVPKICLCTSDDRYLPVTATSLKLVVTTASPTTTLISFIATTIIITAAINFLNLEHKYHPRSTMSRHQDMPDHIHTYEVPTFRDHRLLQDNRAVGDHLAYDAFLLYSDGNCSSNFLSLRPYRCCLDSLYSIIILQLPAPYYKLQQVFRRTNGHDH